MTHATLSAQLKQPEEEGLIIRTEYMQIPLKVKYGLSDIGQEFRPVLSAIQKWGIKYLAYHRENEAIGQEGDGSKFAPL